MPCSDMRRQKLIFFAKKTKKNGEWLWITWTHHTNIGTSASLITAAVRGPAVSSRCDTINADVLSMLKAGFHLRFIHILSSLSPTSDQACPLNFAFVDVCSSILSRSTLRETEKTRTCTIVLWQPLDLLHRQLTVGEHSKKIIHIYCFSLDYKVLLLSVNSVVAYDIWAVFPLRADVHHFLLNLCLAATVCICGYFYFFLHIFSHVEKFNLGF